MSGRVLTVAESDSSGAAGIQADIKTVLALGGYATTALSAVAAQDTKGIERLLMLDPAFIAQQMRVVLKDIGTDAIKIGVLVSEDIVNAVGDVLDEIESKNIPVVVDPSLVARNGSQLMNELAIASLKRRLFLRSTVLTPNKREAELLTGMTVRDMDDMRHAADMMRTLGAENVVLKAGQVGDKVLYLVATSEEERIYERPMLKTPHTLGAGSTLASAMAISLAQKMGIFSAVERSLDFIHQAILHASDFGTEAGPVNHAFDIEKNSSFFSPENVKVHKA